MKFEIRNPKYETISKFQRERGQAALIAVILMLVIMLSAVFGAAAVALKEAKVAEENKKSRISFFAAEAGIEDAVYRLKRNKTLGNSVAIALNDATAVTTITSVPPNRKDILSVGDYRAASRGSRVVLSENASTVSFNYGAQVGDDGMEMDQNSRVIGSIYSNGSIIGEAGAEITGDAFVASGTPPVLNQSWETQNADVPVGVRVGSIITTVDSTGDVGSYTSLAIGADGFARISYIDDTNGDLKFARCTDNNCAGKNLAVVDSAGDVGEVTSLVLGSDGFARMSYYHDGNDDLKFSRCSNADCSSVNLTVVDSAGNTGDFSDIEMGSDGFARIGYWFDSSDDVRFIRCVNDNCTSPAQTNVETSGSVGEYISTELGLDGFARMSYFDDTNNDLKFARCLNADCTTRFITTIDSGGSVGEYTSLALATDDTARISYYDSTNGNLKFVRCTNLDCTTYVLATVDSGGDVGEHTSLTLGSDGFGRISYYDASNGDLKFARCLNVDCASSAISRVDNGSTVGKYNSIAMGLDGLPRISYYAGGSGDLKFVRCSSANCPPSSLQVDVAQSFQPNVTDRIVRVDLRVKKVGSPQDATLRVITDSGGRPSSSASNVIAQGLLNSALIGGSYAWVSVWLLTTPTINANTPYWIVFDSAQDDSNYYVWGGDSGAGYARGNALFSSDWQSASWSALSEDLNFKVFMGGVDNKINDVAVDGNANAHVIDDVEVGGSANGFLVLNSAVGGNANAHTLSNCTIGGNAAYNAISSCTIGGSQTTPNTPPADPLSIPLPITAAIIADWKDEAELGGVCVQPECNASGDFDPSACEVSLGPKKITGDLILNASCPGGQLLTVNGTIWVTGNMDISNNARIMLDSGYGSFSGVVLSDGTIHLSNNGFFRGSGQSGSYLMLLSEASGGGHHGSAIDLHNNASGAIFYAGQGLIYLHNNVNVTELVGKKIVLDNNAVLTYEIGLANMQFSSGPAGGWEILNWEEIIP